MAQGTLALHQHERLGAGALGGLQHGRLDRPGGVVDAHRVERHPLAADQDAGLSGADEAGIEALPTGRSGQLQTGAHLAHRHVGAHRQQPPAGQGGAAGRGHLQSLGLAAQIPDPLARPTAGGGEAGIVGEAGVQAARQVQARLQRQQHIRLHLLRQASARRRQPHHRRLRPTGQGRGHVGHHRNVAVDAGDSPEIRAGMGRIDHGDDRTAAMAQHRQTRLAGEVVEAAVLQQHHRRVGGQHPGPPAAEALGQAPGRSDTPSPGPEPALS